VDDLPIPDDRVARVVLAALRDLLGWRGTDLTTRFSELGGDSLIAVRILARCWRELGVELPITLLAAGTTVTSLIESVRQFVGGAAPEEPWPRPVAAGDSVPLPISLAAIFALHERCPELPVYHVPMRLDLRGRLDRARLWAAVGRLLDRHDALRCRFTVTERGPMVSRREDAPAPVDERDFSDLPPAEKDDRLAAAVHELSVTPLPIDESPLRCVLFRLDAERHVLVVVLHHMVCDAWSLRVLVRDLCLLYRDAAELPAAASFLDVLRHDADRLTDVRAAELARHWRDVLAGVPDQLRLPLDRPRPATRRFSGARLPFTLPAQEVTRLREFASASGVSLFAVLAAALAVVLRRHTGQDDLVIGFPASRRQRAETHEMVGYLINMVPLRVRLSGGHRVHDLVTTVNADVLDAYEYADLPLDRIVDAVGVPKPPGHPPLAQVALVLAPGPDEAVPVPGLSVERDDLATGTSKFDLTWYVEDKHGTLTGYVEYATDVRDADTVRRLHRHVGVVLRRMRDGDQRVADIPLLTDAELAAYPGTRTSTVHVLDDMLRPVPDGAVGEICLGGPDIGDGLPNQPAVTASRYCPDPYAAVPGGRLLRTGRLARHRAGGEPELIEHPGAEHPLEQRESVHALLARVEALSEAEAEEMLAALAGGEERS
jgi:acyl carrier protein